MITPKNEMKSHDLGIHANKKIEEDYFILSKSNRIKEKRNEYQNDTSEINPLSYTSNTKREDICNAILKHQLNKHLMGSSDTISNQSNSQNKMSPPSLFFSAQNEYGIEKFVCTTIRPTLLPYTPLYDYATCALFIAHYLKFEPLEAFEKFGNDSILFPSPTQVLEWRIGDCFDFSIVLVSILIGAGYDAFLVYGTAPRWVCEGNQALLNCPPLDIFESDADSQTIAECHSEHDDINDIGVVDISFNCANEKLQKELSEEEDKSVEGSEIHAWVVIRAGKRGMKETKFIEPSTGKIYTTDLSPYTQITSIWNNENYWINRQDPVAIRAIEKSKERSKISFDLSNLEFWKPVFPIKLPTVPQAFSALTVDNYEIISPDEKTKPFSKSQKVHNGNQDRNLFAHSLSSWVDPLSISSESYNRKYQPNGQRVILYRKAKLELYAEGVNNQGLLSRKTTFFDLARCELHECREKYAKTRRDKLYERKRFILTMSFEEHYAPGNKFAIKKWAEIGGQNRIIDFFPNGRLDGLKCYKEYFGNLIESHFEGRCDKLIYRSMHFQVLIEDGTWQADSVVIPGTEGHLSIIINKIIEKFVITPIMSKSDVIQRTFHLHKNEVETEFYNSHNVIKNICIHRIRRTRDVATPLPQNDKKAAKEAADAETSCICEMRSLHQEIVDMVRLQKKEEEQVQIPESSPSTTYEAGTRELKLGNASNNNCHETPNHYVGEGYKEEVCTKNTQKIDYLSPFLVNVEDTSKISKQEATLIRDACLKTLKERLLQRADIIQNRLNLENSKLSQHQANYQQVGVLNLVSNKGLTTEQFEKICSEAKFRIKILEQRLVQHEDTAVNKYKSLEKKITFDPRLNALHEI